MADDRTPCPSHEALVIQVAGMAEAVRALRDEQAALRETLVGRDGRDGLVGDWNRFRGTVAVIGGAVGAATSLIIALIVAAFKDGGK